MPVIKHKKTIEPTKLIVLSFLLVIVTGTILLSLPIRSRDSSFTPPLDALFTATSATCVTGLAVYDTYSHWNTFGQVFEAASAFSTCGLSAGYTAVPDTFSRLILCLTMFIGRVGPVSFAISLTLGADKRPKNEVIPEGKLFV